MFAMQASLIDAEPTAGTFSNRRYTHSRSAAGAAFARMVKAQREATSLLRQRHHSRGTEARRAAEAMRRREMQARLASEQAIDALKEAALAREREWESKYGTRPAKQAPECKR